MGVIYMPGTDKIFFSSILIVVWGDSWTHRSNIVEMGTRMKLCNIRQPVTWYLLAMQEPPRFVLTRVAGATQAHDNQSGRSYPGS